VAVVAFAVLLAFGLGYLHLLTGLAYEFHVFFVIPVLAVAWFVGRRPAYVIASTEAGVWFAADRMLDGGQAAPFALLFNTSTRLAIFLFVAWVLGQMRAALDRESRLAREDVLTSLPNRREFYERGRRAFAQARRQAGSIAAVLIDLDRFKEVNDAQGHETGDRLLATVGHTIRTYVRESDIAGRLGGDEFALLLPNMEPSAARQYVENLRQRLLAAMGDQTWPVTFSIGVANCHAATRDLDSLLAEADAAMYEAKKKERDRIAHRS
jgi:diguanylate cyclase (GGDEF)-like protein